MIHILKNKRRKPSALTSGIPAVITAVNILTATVFAAEIKTVGTSALTGFVHSMITL